MISPITFANSQHKYSYQKNSAINPQFKGMLNTDMVCFTGRKIFNNIVMKQDYKNHFTFFENGVEIGYAKFSESDKVSSLKGFAPEDWFIEGGVPDGRGNYPLKPSIFINELVMNDKVGLTGYHQDRAGKKKYGVMCMQRILEWAQERGFGTRISLYPGKTHSDIHPAPFYAKIGFDVAPEIANIMSTISCAKQIDGRYVSRGQEVFLVAPDVLKNYSLG